MILTTLPLYVAPEWQRRYSVLQLPELGKCRKPAKELMLQM